MKPSLANRRSKYGNFWLVILVGGMILGIDAFGGTLRISSTLIVSVTVIGLLIWGAMLLWNHANRNATGDEWWQDDSASGWRGY